jgi:hypothetical protein
MAYEVKPVYGPDLSQLLMQGLGAYRQVKGIQQQEAMQKAQMEGAARDREMREQEFQMRKGEYEQKQKDVYSKEFAKERANTAKQMRGKSYEEKVQILEARIEGLKEQGKDPSATKRLLDMYKTGLQGKQNLETAMDRRQSDQAYEDSLQLKAADERIEEAYQTGINRGDIEPDVEDKGAWRVLSNEEKLKLGITAEGQFQMSPEGKIQQVGSKGQQINVMTGDRIKTGPVPAGYAMIMRDGKPVMVQIEGGPAALKTAEDKKKDFAKAQTEQEEASIVKEDIARLKNLVEKSPWYNEVTGISGAIMSNIPGTARKDAEALQTTIGANIGFDRLQAMRDASKTGGALGAISEREMKQLEAVKGSINLSQSDEQILRNLERLNDIYSRILEKARAYPNAEEFGFGGAKPMNVNTQEMPENVRQRYY